MHVKKQTNTRKNSNILQKKQTITTTTVEVTSTQVILTAGAIVNTFDKSAYATLLQLVNAMNLTSGWSFVLSSTLYNSLPISVLDLVDVGAKALPAGQRPARIKKDANEVAELFSDSSIASIISQEKTGLMEAASETALSAVS